MTDRYSGHEPGLDSPAVDAEAVVNDVPFSNVSRALYVGGAGHVVVLTAKGNEVVFNSVPAGTILPIRAKRVLTQGVGSPASATTTATNITAMW